MGSLIDTFWIKSPLLLDIYNWYIFEVFGVELIPSSFDCNIWGSSRGHSSSQALIMRYYFGLYLVPKLNFHTYSQTCLRNRHPFRFRFCETEFQDGVYSKTQFDDLPIILHVHFDNIHLFVLKRGVENQYIY